MLIDWFYLSWIFHQAGSQEDDRRQHFSPPNKILPPIPAGMTTPFYYSSLSNIIVHYLVDKERVKPFFQGKFEHSGLRPALFDGKASVSYNFQVYTGFFSAGVDAPQSKWSSPASGVTQELELNIVAFPKGRAHDVPDITFDQWLRATTRPSCSGTIASSCRATIPPPSLRARNSSANPSSRPPS